LNHQDYKRRVVYLESTCNLRYLVYHCNVCARIKKTCKVYFIERAEYQLRLDAAAAGGPKNGTVFVRLKY